MEHQLRNHVRLALVKLREYNSLGEQHEQQLRRILSPGDSIDLTVAKLLQCEPRNDYQLLILMTFLSELVGVLQQPVNQNTPLHQRLDSLMLEHLWPLLQREPVNRQITSFYHLKKMEILRLLLVYKLTGECGLPTYEKLYRQLKQCQASATNINRQHFKVTFVGTHRSIFEQCQNQLITEFVVAELFEDSLKALEESSQGGFEWMRTIDTRFLALQHLITHRKMQPLLLYKMVFLVVKASALKNIYVHVLSLGLFQALAVVLQSSSRSPLLYILISHVLINPLIKQLEVPDDIMFVELLLSQVMLLFRNRKLLFAILRAADTNFHSQGIVYDLVSKLYDYVEADQKKPTRSPIYELIKKTVKAIMDSVRQILQRRKETDKVLPPELQSKLRFYRLKQKQYQTMVNSFNTAKKPIELAGNGTNDYQMEHLIRFIKRSPHINAQKMIEVLGLNTPTSKSLLKRYMESFKLEGYPVEQALRIVLTNFFLIGESQQLNRVIEQLTLHISHSSKTRDWDSIYLQATAILMLNTDLHNPMNQKKMSEQDWMKIVLRAKGVTEAEGATIYHSILNSKIQCFRDYGSLHNMNLSSFLYNFYTDSRCWTLNYIDPELKEFEEVPQLTRYLSYEVLEGVLVGKEVDKILKLVDVFVYKDDVYECEILQTLRVLVERGKQDTPANIFAVASKKVNFQDDEISEQYLSYYWLCAKIIGQQINHIPVEQVCDFLLSTFRTRKYVEDDLYCRTQLKVRKVKEAMKQHKSRLLKKTGSILDIFSNFLADKESSEDEFKPVRHPTEPKKYMAFRKLALDIQDQLLAERRLRDPCIIHLMAHIRNPNNKMPVENFIGLLYLLFDVVCLSSDPQCLETTAPLFEELLEEGHSPLSQRLAELKKKKQKKYQLICALTQYYLMKILLEYYREVSKYRLLAKYAIEFISVCSPPLLQDFVDTLKNIQEDTNESQCPFLKDINIAVVKSCKDNNITEGRVRDYVDRLQLVQDCRVVVNGLIGKVTAEAAVTDQHKKPSDDVSPNGVTEEVPSQPSAQPAAPLKPQAVDVATKQKQDIEQQKKQEQAQQPEETKDEKERSDVEGNEIKQPKLEATEQQPKEQQPIENVTENGFQHLVKGELIESQLQKSQFQKMEELMRQAASEAPPVVQQERVAENKLSNQEFPTAQKQPHLQVQIKPISQAEPVAPKPAQANHASEHTNGHPTQEQILQVQREYFAKLIGERGEENLSELELPLYML